MFDRTNLTPLEKHVHLAIATPHPEMLEYIKFAFDENYITTEGTNIREVEKIAAESAGVKYAVGLACGRASVVSETVSASSALRMQESDVMDSMTRFQGFPVLSLPVILPPSFSLRTLTT